MLHPPSQRDQKRAGLVSVALPTIPDFLFGCHPECRFCGGRSQSVPVCAPGALPLQVCVQESISPYRVKERIRAIWKTAWERGINISFEFGVFDGGRDKCRACGRQRRFHRRGDDHKFVEAENDK